MAASWCRDALPDEVAMSIEFRCTQCNKLLRTGDDTAGKQAKCPECGAVVDIPARGGVGSSAGGPPPSSLPPSSLPPSSLPPSSLPPASLPPSGPPPPGSPPSSPFEPTRSPFAPGGPMPEGGTDAQNPYRSPGAYGGPLPSYGQPAGAFAPTTIEMEDIFSRTWIIFKQQWGPCLLAMIVVWAISLAFNMVFSFGLNFAAGLSRDQAIILVSNVASYLITNLFSIWLGIGLALYFLRIARGQRAELSELFAGGPYFLRTLGATILVILAVLAGWILCIVPGIIFSLMLSQFYYLILDRNVGVIDSLSISKDIMNGNKMTLFLIGLIGGVVGILIVVFTCTVGLLVVIPFFALLRAVIYLAITGQPTADRLMYRPPMA
jgi:uncharacterized membrane protein/DNA-directed RNA polymerase subunit RPC12/RpoP